ncbi:MAG TPA: carbamate kinase [Solirubrobacteraceae bacterium]
MSAPGLPTVVVALGGNALLPRGASLEAGAEHAAARRAARLLAPVTETARLVVTHGNGPQVGLLALMNDAYTAVEAYPLDVLGAETEGELGYIIEMELDNAVGDRDTVAIVTRTEVSGRDPAFEHPTKFIGPVYEEAAARALSDKLGWTVRPDGDAWRRVVPSPEPLRILQLPAIAQLVESDFLVVCAGGGGVPVVLGDDGSYSGVEAVIDKDLASSLLACDLGAAALVLATDVDGVYERYGAPDARRLDAVTPAVLRAGSYAAGSMGPKVEAACRFVERTGGRAAIGALDDVGELVAGRTGTQVRPG